MGYLIFIILDSEVGYFQVNTLPHLLIKMWYLISKTFLKSELGYGVENFQEANWDI